MARAKKTTAPARQPLATIATKTKLANRSGPVGTKQADRRTTSVPIPMPTRTLAPASKQAGIIAALRRPEGATVAELMRVTGWLSHSVRGVLSGALKRRLGLVLDSRVEADRGRVYRIANPQPVPPASSAEPAAATLASGSQAARRAKRGSARTLPPAAER